uniref:Lipid droplet-associated serine hydrolase n=1 Tax=Bracon brevicornis TaxID=1563983 RepID=A0A6V7HVG0_9HYME
MLRFLPIICFFAWIFTFFPLFIREFLIRIFGMFVLGFGSESVKPVTQLVDPLVLRRVFLLAKDELEHVRELNHEIFSKYSDKFYVYYGSTDRWTPKHFYTEFKEKHPNVQAELCKRGFRHAFVLSHGKEVGNMVGDLINETIH